MHALSHYAEKKKSAFDDFPLAQMKKKGATLVWRVVFYGRSVSRAKPALSAAPCEEFTDGDYVEVFDYHLKWLKVQHRNEKGKIEKGKSSWLLAVDLWSNSDLVTLCGEEESAKIRAKWDKTKKKKKKKSSPILASAPLPAVSGPAMPDAFQIQAAKLARAKQLEEQERLRQLRLKIVQQKAPPSMPELEYVDDPKLQPRSEWTRGSKVSVWSASQKKWFPGVIIKIADEGTPKEKVTVHYKSAGRKSMKMMPRLSKMIRSRAAKSSPTNSATNDDKENVKSPGPQTTLLATPNAAEQKPSSGTQPTPAASSSVNREASAKEGTTAAPVAATECTQGEAAPRKPNSDLPPIPSARVETASDTADSDYAEEAAQSAAQEPPMPDPNQLPVGWTEHLDKRSGRYYYNNKSTGETLWDTMAVKRGVISKVRPG